jgi:hypothetical protein
MIFLAVCVFPHDASSYKIGSRVLPALVNVYSTLGGISLNSLRFIKPNISSSFNSFERTLPEIEGMICFSLPNRITLSPIQFRIIGFHLPPMMLMARVTGQLSGLSIKRGFKFVVTIWLLVFAFLVTNVYLVT